LLNETDQNDMSIEQIIAECVTIAAIPAVVMLAGSLYAILSPNQPSKNLAYAIQHLAAGILLSAIALELMPRIVTAKGFNNLVGIIVGFSLGAMVMIVLPLLLKEDENNGESIPMLEDECEEGRTDKQMRNVVPTASSHPQSENAVHTSRIAKVKVLCRRLKNRIFRIFDKEGDLNSAKLSTMEVGPFPAAFAAAVYIDSAMDGLLVGISILSGARCSRCSTRRGNS
jgi:zinc transporter ZupT